MEIPYAVHARPDTGLANGKFGTWLFLASEVMLFGALFATYVLLRVGNPAWPAGHTILNVPLATLNTAILISSSVTMVLAWASCVKRNLARFRLFLGLTVLLGFGFLIVKYFEYSAKFEHGLLPSTNTFLAIYFTLTGLHGLHVLGGMVLNAYFLGRAGIVAVGMIVLGGVWALAWRLAGFGPVVLALLAAVFVFALFQAYRQNRALEQWAKDPEWFANRVENAGLFWHFVDLVWIFLFPILYLLPGA